MSDESKKARTLHFVITVQWATANRGVACATTHGTIQPEKGVDRQQLFLDIVNHAAKLNGLPPGTDGLPPGVTVLFFSLEPNQLS